MKKKLNLHLLWNTHTVKIDKYLESINILVYGSICLFLYFIIIHLMQFKAFYLLKGRTNYKEKEKCERGHIVMQIINYEWYIRSYGVIEESGRGI